MSPSSSLETSHCHLGEVLLDLDYYVLTASGRSTFDTTFLFPTLFPLSKLDFLHYDLDRSAVVGQLCLVLPNLGLRVTRMTITEYNRRLGTNSSPSGWTLQKLNSWRIPFSGSAIENRT
ncbi:hypothetical protein VTK73DRAFT_5472 [Phialemonium thermophilum]|uniref:Uncharacterized protein n=1 Tax=Phialemonium thermophilum TaxID=223376 RepID=A0ABR3V1S8_9PEZI